MSKSNYDRMKEAAKRPPKAVIPIGTSTLPTEKVLAKKNPSAPLPPKKDKKQKPPKPKEAGVGAMRLPRLPDGSAFEAAWNAAKQEWTGMLMIPVPAEQVCDADRELSNARFDTGCKTFTQTSGAVRPLLFKLDSQYREWLKTQEPKTENQ